MERFVSNLNISFSHLKKCDHFHQLVKGGEGAGHWYALFASNDPDIVCGESCNQQARFVLFTHYHEDGNDVTAICYEHAPEYYKELLNRVTAG